MSKSNDGAGFKAEVARIVTKQYGVTLEDMGIEDTDLVTARLCGDTPQQLADDLGEKYGLAPLKHSPFESGLWA